MQKKIVLLFCLIVSGTNFVANGMEESCEPPRKVRRGGEEAGSAQHLHHNQLLEHSLYHEDTNRRDLSDTRFSPDAARTRYILSVAPFLPKDAVEVFERTMGPVEASFVRIMYGSHERSCTSEALGNCFSDAFWEPFRDRLRKIDEGDYTKRDATISALGAIKKQIVALARKSHRTIEAMQTSDPEQYTDFCEDMIIDCCNSGEDDDASESPCFFEIDGQLAAQMARELQELMDSLEQ